MSHHRRLVLPLLISLALAAGAAPTPTAIWSSTPGDAPAGVEEITVAVLHPGAGQPIDATPFFDPTGPLTATWQEGDQRIPVTLVPLEPPPTPPAPGHYAHRRYRLDRPTTPTGSALLIVDLNPQPVCLIPPPTDSTTALAATSAPTPPLPADPPPTTSPRPVTELFDRGFMDRFDIHDPIYFIYGPDDPVAKFQFSFKYRLSTVHQRRPDTLPTTLQFGFTQRSLWDIDATSSPFYDTSYIPSVFIERLAAHPAPGKDASPWLGVQAGFRHESNGRDGLVSRSLNQVFARGAFYFGDPESLSLVIAPEMWSYVGGVANNPSIRDYRGNARLTLALNHARGPSLIAQTWTGHDFDHLSTQIDLNIPVRLGMIDVGTYLLVQYYRGYGESLLSYDQKTETARFGLAFVR